jgi:hypothetical protein
VHASRRKVNFTTVNEMSSCQSSSGAFRSNCIPRADFVFCIADIFDFADIFA